jgi:nanoRNase/pAp phosphatase (c-di-AMP/oligoRNAs hydrolase)
MTPRPSKPDASKPASASSDDILGKASQSLARLKEALHGARRLHIFTHDNPDPDALASALALKYLARQLWQIRARILAGGIVGRAENRAMLYFLKIRLTNPERMPTHALRTTALIDTQPRTGNNSFPPSLTPTIVIDHHPRSRRIEARFIDLRPDVGASATILSSYLFSAGIEIPSQIATALFYAIHSETQALGREATRFDEEMYLRLFPLTNRRLLAKIQNPSLQKAYFAHLNAAISNAFTHKNVAGTRLGTVTYPDVVAQIADLLVALERVTWSICLGRYKHMLVISIRTQNVKGNAGRRMRQLIGRRGAAGGHDMMAGAHIDCTDKSPDQWDQLETDLIMRFLHLLGHKSVAELVPLVAHS